MPRLMKAIGRLLAPVVLLGVLTAACTGSTNVGSGGGPTRTGTTSASVSPSVAPTSTTAGTGVYVYQNAGLTATLDLEGKSGTLEIQNKTGRELAPPSFYLLDARDGHRVDGRVRDATSTPDGQTTTFDVSVSGLETWNIGLAVLLIGHDNFGAFVRQ
jgi:hypothetical protein